MSQDRILIDLDEYHTPRVCEECGGIMIFKGVGEYQCEDCKKVAYDDYGKVRLYIENHKGANASEIEAATGVKQRSIRTMVKEGRLEVTQDSRSFLHCEICGKEIRFGRLCQTCETNCHRKFENEQRMQHKSNIQGFGQGKEVATGERRVTFDK